MTKLWRVVFAVGTLVLQSGAQTTSSPSTKPAEHVLGTITSIDGAAHTAVVKEDKTGTEQTVLLSEARTLLKVPPGAKDLKSASRFTADQLAVGDRVDVRGSKSSDDPSKIAARSVVLMSGRDLEAAHAAQAAEWRNSTAGVITGLDAAKGTVTASERSASGPKPVVIQTSPQTDFTRYSPETPGSPVKSQFDQLQTGDHVRVIGEASADGNSITARKLYSGAFRVLNGAIESISPDGREFVIRDLATKKPVTVALSAESEIHRLPPELAMRLARRAGGQSAAAPPPSSGNITENEPRHETNAGTGRRGMGPGSGGMRRGDISGMIEHLPKIALSDLKQGDAVVVSGVQAHSDGDTVKLIANNVIAGVEPILQASPARGRSGGGGSAGGDWGLGEMNIPQ